eukprot:COSAG02_NODE_52559_length_307_cov_0.706731_1_plen_63_part_10
MMEHVVQAAEEEAARMTLLVQEQASELARLMTDSDREIAELKGEIQRLKVRELQQQQYQQQHQ